MKVKESNHRFMEMVLWAGSILTVACVFMTIYAIYTTQHTVVPDSGPSSVPVNQKSENENPLTLPFFEIHETEVHSISNLFVMV